VKSATTISFGEKYTDLATFESMEEIQRLNRPELLTSLVWIGLRDDPKSWKESMGNDVNSWRWSATGETSQTGYQNWDSIEPNYYQGKQTCVIMMMPTGKWFDKDCRELYHFVCYAGK
uniref:C-type lectin domain-containing protein n=1 Tax=Sphaeramia orbicularis TaxID=375764 RepID=A0A672YCU3_9TELE